MKIALLFLTRKELNHPHLWQKMLEDVEGLFNVYIHPKEPIEDSFFKKFTIPEIVPTSYLIHTKAWQALIKEALKNEDNEKFIYLSESCFPLYPLKDIYEHLIREPNSYMRYSPPWWTRESGRDVLEIPQEHRWGNAEWIILNRKHAQVIAEDREIIDLFDQYKCDNESYPSSLLSLKGLLDEVIYRQTTYAAYIKYTGSYPYHFTAKNSLEEMLIANGKREGVYLHANSPWNIPLMSYLRLAINACCLPLQFFFQINHPYQPI